MTSSEQAKVPPQVDGEKSDIIERRNCSSAEEAAQVFLESKKKLLDISNWGKISKGLSADFVLIDGQGNPLNREPERGDYIRIDIPGPGSVAGHGYDWVKIELVEIIEPTLNGEELAQIRVRPTEDPLSPEGPAHFFDSRATSTFLVHKKGLTILAAVHGRNEVPAEAEKNIDTIRNKVIGKLAILGASKIQWQKLCEALLGI